ncbi:hypothetical protein TCAL_01550 [Tigriopus californicus]|uniref:UDP-glucuronosyltransferase n=1 Tax=Tigriopus californicus TaxID=6832 RepID=A0A553P740_TIGCA|nr:UDP-glycosyltransferase UGT5-like [Tigriopus californicus]TRY73509.1 hypothetical protein TCAL_01550 [Tigriopus californicus]|eukprot:TCALIF_01550-PA protein Name:"Similar to Ugt1a1 UDP-glucuronosyltransferase 1-1 (Rattus norvegicus)" AED:0.05 eAED:0.05 QI:401/1/1/1/1/1/4/14/530
MPLRCGAFTFLWIALGLSLSAPTQEVSAGRIFMYMNVGSKSHWFTWRPLAVALANKGHHLTIVSPFPDQFLGNHSHVDFIVTGHDLAHDQFSKDVFAQAFSPTQFQRIEAMLVQAQNNTFHNPRFQRLLNNQTHFDVAFISPDSIDVGFYAALKLFHAPIIYYHSATRLAIVDKVVGNPIEPAFVPNTMSSFSQKMDFWQRLQNTVGVTAITNIFGYRILGLLSHHLRDLLHLDQTPDLWSMAHEGNFAFYNGHPLFDGVRPTNPNTQFIGGIHTRPAKPLTGLLRNWVDESRQGVVYVSFGSVLNTSIMPEKTRDLFLRVFAQLNLRVIWKWETGQIANVSDNVLLCQWCPQQDLLGHRNVKLFLSHGGLLGTQESLYHNKPMLFLPAFADQFMNAKRAQELGYGQTLHWETLTEKDLLSAIERMLKVPKYKANALKYGAIFRDQPIQPIDKAVYWTEFIMRHKGAPHLQVAHTHLNWFQKNLVDVYVFLVLSFIVIVSVLVKASSYLYQYLLKPIMCSLSQMNKVKLS